MKTHIRLRGIAAKYVGQPLVSALQAIHPSSSHLPTWYECEIPEDDERWNKLQRVLLQANLRPWNRKGECDETKYYVVDYIAAYSRDELKDANYVLVGAMPFHGVEAEGQLPSGGEYLVTLEELAVVDDADLVTREGTEFIVPERVHKLLEGARLNGLSFAPLSVLDENDDSLGQGESVGGPWWRLLLAKEAPQRLPPSKAHSHFTNPPYTYPAAALAALDPFDLALAPDSEHHPFYKLLASRRAYAFFRAHDLKVQAEPVIVKM